MRTVADGRYTNSNAATLFRLMPDKLSLADPTTEGHVRTATDHFTPPGAPASRSSRGHTFPVHNLAMADHHKHVRPRRASGHAVRDYSRRSTSPRPCRRVLSRSSGFSDQKAARRHVRLVPTSTPLMLSATSCLASHIAALWTPLCLLSLVTQDDRGRYVATGQDVYVHGLEIHCGRRLLGMSPAQQK